MSESANPFRGPSNEKGGKRYWRLYLAAGLSLALIGIYLAYALNWINQRHYAMTWFNVHHCGPVQMIPGRAPLAIGILGEPGYETISLAQDSDRPWDATDLSVKEEMKRLYPEAEVYALSFSEATALWKSMGVDAPPRH